MKKNQEENYPYPLNENEDKMKDVKILGFGCARCQLLKEHVEQAVAELGINITLEEIRDVNKVVVDWGVLITPAIVIDGQIKVAGRLPSIKELKKLLN